MISAEPLPLVRGELSVEVAPISRVYLPMSRLYLPQVRGELSFEVVIKSQGGEGDEGLEVGVTTTPPQRADMNRSDYCAATVMPNSLSSDTTLTLTLTLT